jgi:hypothetical protein
VNDDSNVLHVEPVNDLVAHDTTEGALCDCVCGPDIEFLVNGIVVIHHSLDGRELGEEPRV